VFPDDLILAAMTRFVFCAGFYSKVIDAKWDSFESAFQKFNPSRCAEMTEERFDKLLKCKDIVRNGPKILSVHKNGQFVMELAEKHGSAAQFFAKWPDADYVGLLDFLKKKDISNHIAASTPKQSEPTPSGQARLRVVK